MLSISSLVNTQWFMGIPFNDTANPRLGIAEYSEQILGQYLLGFQLGNEPDLYGSVRKFAVTGRHCLNPNSTNCAHKIIPKLTI